MGGARIAAQEVVAEVKTYSSLKPHKVSDFPLG